MSPRVVRLPTVLFLLALTSTIGCRAHVELRPVAADATDEQRRFAYDRLQPINRGYGSFVRLSNDRIEQELDVERMQLAGGDTIYHANDLIPVVDPISPTALAGARYDRWESIDTVSVYVGGTLVALGALVAAASAPQFEDPTTPLLVSGGIAVSGLLVRTVLGLVASSGMTSARSEAFSNYHKDLRDHLGIE